MNAYQMGSNSIDRGNRDHWTMHRQTASKRPSGHLQRSQKQEQRSKSQSRSRKQEQEGRSKSQPEARAAKRRRAEARARQERQRSKSRSKSRKADRAEARAERQEAETAPERSPTSSRTSSASRPIAIRAATSCPFDQPDFPTATKFVNTLIKNGVTVQRATAAFEVAGKTYPAGSYVVQTAQAFRPYILDLFEPQDHPHDVALSGRAADSALRQRRLDAGLSDGRRNSTACWTVSPAPSHVSKGWPSRRPASCGNPESAAGFLLDAPTNDSFIVVNRLLGKRFRVQRLLQPTEREGKTYPAGTWYIPNDAEVDRRCCRQYAEELGLNFVPVDKPFDVRADRR